jgi:hypothetical protein
MEKELLVLDAFNPLPANNGCLNKKRKAPVGSFSPVAHKVRTPL